MVVTYTLHLAKSDELLNFDEMLNYLKENNVPKALFFTTLIIVLKGFTNCLKI